MRRWIVILNGHWGISVPLIFKPKMSLQSSITLTFPDLNEHVLVLYIGQKTAEQQWVDICRHFDFAIDRRLHGAAAVPAVLAWELKMAGNGYESWWRRNGRFIASNAMTPYMLLAAFCRNNFAIMIFTWGSLWVKTLFFLLLFARNYRFPRCSYSKLGLPIPSVVQNKKVGETWTLTSSGFRGGRGDARPPPCRPKKQKKKKKKKEEEEEKEKNRPWDSSSQTTAPRCLRGAWMHCCACQCPQGHTLGFWRSGDDIRA